MANEPTDADDEAFLAQQTALGVGKGMPALLAEQLLPMQQSLQKQADAHLMLVAKMDLQQKTLNAILVKLGGEPVPDPVAAADPAAVDPALPD